MNLLNLFAPPASDVDEYENDQEPIDLTSENISQALEEMTISPKLLAELKSINKQSKKHYVLRVLICCIILTGFVAVAFFGPWWIKIQAVLMVCIGLYLLFMPQLLMPPRKNATHFFDGGVNGYLGCITCKFRNKDKGYIGFDDYVLEVPSEFEYAGIDKDEVALVIVNDKNELMVFGSDTLLH